MQNPSSHPVPALPCVIYCRVSSAKQLKEGDGLHGQEQRCREYARSRGYQVLQVFQEQGLSGSLLDRQAMNAVLAFLDQQPQETIVLIEDLKRFARDVAVHFDLKLAIDARGGRLESPLFRFEDTPEGRFIETIVAAQAELERNQNRRQVKSRMRARLEQGYWVFASCPGYHYRHDPIQKQVLVPDERAPLVREALEGFASGRFQGLSELARFLLRAGFFAPSTRAVPTPPEVFARPLALTSRHVNLASRMLRQVLYTGSLEYAPWSIGLREAKHPALISWDTYARIQERLDGSRTFARVNVREEFILRGLIACAGCGKPLTGSWSRGHLKRYPYYHCGQRGCKRYGKTMGRDKMEESFTGLLKGLEASDDTLEIMEGVLTDFWRLRQSQAGSRREASRQALKQAASELEALTDRLAQTQSLAVMQVLERKIEKVEEQRARLAREAAQAVEERVDAGTAFRRVRGLLKSPLQTWKEADVAGKRLVVQRVFERPPCYDRNEGYGTLDLSLPYLVSGLIEADVSRLVDTAGNRSNVTGLVSGIDWEEFIGFIASWAISLTDLADASVHRRTPLTQSCLNIAV